MKKIIILSFLILFICGLLANDEIALVMKSKGNVSLIREETTSKIQKGQLLENNDELISEENSFSAIKFIDGSSILKLFPNSTLKITANKENNKLNKRSFLEKGEVLSKIKKKMGTFEIETPTSVASVKGTEFLLVVDKDGNTIVYTISGIVTLQNKKGGDALPVKPGEKGTSSPNGDIKIGQYDDEELGEGVKAEIDDNNENILEIEMQSPSNEKKVIKIEFE